MEACDDSELVGDGLVMSLEQEPAGIRSRGTMTSQRAWGGQRVPAAAPPLPPAAPLQARALRARGDADHDVNKGG